jgi:hypothetical protein
MVYYQSVAWAVDAGFKSYLDSTLAYDVYRLLPEADCMAHGQALLESGLSVNPYNIVLADAAVAKAATPESEFHFWKSLQNSLAQQNGKIGCSVDSLYNQTVQNYMFAAIAKLPVPATKTEANAIYKTLQDEKCENEDALALYQTATAGVGSLLSRTEEDFKTHLASARDEASCELMAKELVAAAAKITEKSDRTQWLLARWEQIQGHEVYFGKGEKITTDVSATALAKLAGKKLSPPPVLDKPLLELVSSELREGISGARDMKTCKKIAGEISAIAKEDSDASGVHSWLESLSRLMSGHEQFSVKNAKNVSKLQRDPCADTIAQLLAGGLDSKQSNAN